MSAFYCGGGSTESILNASIEISLVCKMLAKFFQHYRLIVGERVIETCLHVLNNKLGDVNHMLVSMVPKIKNLGTMADFCPIRSCTILYKIIVKAIVNRF